MSNRAFNPTPQFYRTAVQLSLSAPTHNYGGHFVQSVPSYRPRVHTHFQNPSFTQSRSHYRVPRSPDHSPSRSRSRNIHDPFYVGHHMSNTPEMGSEGPLSTSSQFEKNNSYNTVERQPEPTIKEFDDLGLPYFDLRYALPESIAHLKARRFELKQPSATSIRIISKDFPWNIHVAKKCKNSNITWKDMLEALYNGLHKRIEDSEWPLLMSDRDPQYRVDIETNANTRINDPDRTAWTNLPVKQAIAKYKKTDDWSIRRIDFLGRKTAFLGFKQDKYLEEMRRIPQLPRSEDLLGEAWVVELGMSAARRSGRGRRIIS